MEEQWARGWSSSEKRICSFCINDYALKAVVEAEEIEGDGPCTTCGHAVSAPFDSLLDAFVDGIHYLYDDALNSVPYVSSEGGFVGAETWDTWDPLEDFHDVFDDEASPETIEELRARMESRDWVDRTDPDYGPAALLDAAWLEFCRVIKHETRYVFWLQREAVDERADNRRPWEIEPATALRRVGDMIDELDLFKDYNLGHLFFRARTFAKNQDVPSSAKSLGRRR